MTLSGRTAIAVLAALALSVAVNFGLVGFMAARSFPDRVRPAPAERLAALGPRALPPALRADVAARLPSQSPALKGALKDVRDARKAVFAAMRAEPYDRAAVTTALTTLHQKLDTLSALGEAAILDALDDAPADVRATIGQSARDRGG